MITKFYNLGSGCSIGFNEVEVIQILSHYNQLFMDSVNSCIYLFILFLPPLSNIFFNEASFDLIKPDNKGLLFRRSVLKSKQGAFIELPWCTIPELTWFSLDADMALVFLVIFTAENSKMVHPTGCQGLFAFRRRKN